VFDLFYLDGLHLRQAPLIERKPATRTASEGQISVQLARLDEAARLAPRADVAWRHPTLDPRLTKLVLTDSPFRQPA
jgi:hypothetical protein